MKQFIPIGAILAVIGLILLAYPFFTTQQTKEVAHVGPLHVDENQQLAVHFQVRSIPHVIAFAEGQVVDQFIGVLPAIVFVMQSLDTLTCYGKRIAAWRMGFDVRHDRGSPPTPFGLECARRFAASLGAFGDRRQAR